MKVCPIHLEALYNNKKVLIKRYDGAFFDFKRYGIKINISNGNEKKFVSKLKHFKSNNNKNYLILMNENYFK